MTRIRYMMPARSQGDLYMQRQQTRLAEKDVYTWLSQQLDGFYCGLQVMYTPPLHAMACTDEARVVDPEGRRTSSAFFDIALPGRTVEPAVGLRVRLGLRDSSGYCNRRGGATHAWLPCAVAR